MTRPAIAIVGLTACSGCQLTILNCEGALQEITERFDLSWFPLGESAGNISGPFDAALVEGAVSTPADRAMLLDIRSRSRLLIALGTCAVWGGIAALANQSPRHDLAYRIYGREAGDRDTFSPVPLVSCVPVDTTIVGCPPEKHEVLSLLSAILRDTTPDLPRFPVCTECRARENACLLMERHQLCLGPVTRGGCNGRCPAVAVPCEGCRGPTEEVNCAEEIALLETKGFSRDEILSRLHRFYQGWDHEQRS